MLKFQKERFQLNKNLYISVVSLFLVRENMQTLLFKRSTIVHWTIIHQTIWSLMDEML